MPRLLCISFAFFFCHISEKVLLTITISLGRSTTVIGISATNFLSCWRNFGRGVLEQNRTESILRPQAFTSGLCATRGTTIIARTPNGFRARDHEQQLQHNDETNDELRRRRRESDATRVGCSPPRRAKFRFRLRCQILPLGHLERHQTKLQMSKSKAAIVQQPESAHDPDGRISGTMSGNTTEPARIPATQILLLSGNHPFQEERRVAGFLTSVKEAFRCPNLYSAAQQSGPTEPPAPFPQRLRRTAPAELPPLLLSGWRAGPKQPARDHIADI